MRPRVIMKTAEVAQYLRVNRSTVYRLARMGQIPCFKIASDYRFDSEVIEKWTTDTQVKVRSGLRPT